jgi:hypothetical protein
VVSPLVLIDKRATQEKKGKRKKKGKENMVIVRHHFHGSHSHET